MVVCSLLLLTTTVSIQAGDISKPQLGDLALSQFYVFGFTNADLGASLFDNVAPVPEPGTALWGAALGLATCLRRFRAARRSA